MTWTEEEIAALKLAQASKKMMLAALLDRFPGLDIPKIMKLTMRQLCDFYFHKRDAKTGALKEPIPAMEPEKEEAPKTYEQALAGLDFLAATFGIVPEEKAKIKADVDRKYGKTSAGEQPAG